MNARLISCANRQVLVALTQLALSGMRKRIIVLPLAERPSSDAHLDLEPRLMRKRRASHRPPKCQVRPIRSCVAASELIVSDVFQTDNDPFGSQPGTGPCRRGRLRWCF
jgi:hypothetical protein